MIVDRLIWSDIVNERHEQHDKWGGQHSWGVGDCSSDTVDLMVKVAVLTEEVGEVARAALDGNRANLRQELVQVAAVAVAIIEWCDR
jgi:hypothetical protein